MDYIVKADVPYFSEAEIIVDGFGFRLVSLRLVRRKSEIRVFAIIFSPAGIGVDDCALVHRALTLRFEALLQTQDVAFEVSSPGTNRVLKDTLEFSAFIGEQLGIWLDGAHDWLVGTLKHAAKEGIVLETREDASRISYKDIRKAKLY